MPVIIGPSLFFHDQTFSQFQSVNKPGMPLVELSEGQQDAIFVKLAEEILSHLKS